MTVAATAATATGVVDRIFPKKPVLSICADIDAEMYEKVIRSGQRHPVAIDNLVQVFVVGNLMYAGLQLSARLARQMP